MFPIEFMREHMQFTNSHVKLNECFQCVDTFTNRLAKLTNLRFVSWSTLSTRTMQCI